MTTKDYLYVCPVDKGCPWRHEPTCRAVMTLHIVAAHHEVLEPDPRAAGRIFRRGDIYPRYELRSA